MLMNMKELLSVANEHNFAVPAFNIGTGQILNAVVECCEEKQAPVILAIHPNELEFQGDSFIEMCKDRANKSHVPMCIHLDHGATMEQVQRAIRCGFTSVMIDASSESFEDNIKITKEVIKVAHPLGVSVEAELGTIGDIKEDSGNREIGSKEIIFTKPEDAKKFVPDVMLPTALPEGYQFESGSYATTSKFVTITILYSNQAEETIQMRMRWIFDPNDAESQEAVAIEGKIQSVLTVDQTTYTISEKEETNLVSWNVVQGEKDMFYTITVPNSIPNPEEIAYSFQ